MKTIQKYFYRTGNFPGFLGLVFSCLVLVSCSSKSSTAPSTPTGSTSFSYNNPEILAAITMQGGVASAASVLIYTTGQAANNANVTLTGPSSLSLPLTLFENLSAGGEYIDYYYSATGWTYTPNQNYTMTVSYGGMTFQSSITSVGGVVFTPVTSGTKGVSITWSGGGNENTAMAIGSGDYTYGPNITSPYFISQSSLAGYTAGSYDIQMNADETKTSAFSGGAFTASSFTASDQESTTY